LSKLGTEIHKASLWHVLPMPTHRRQSDARHLTQLAVNHAFSNHALRVYPAVFVPNPSAVRLYQPLGFNATGCELEVLNIAGRFMDVQYMSLRRPV
jgi:RimJ/RimL family protein N-acetyltransferase